MGAVEAVVVGIAVVGVVVAGAAWPRLVAEVWEGGGEEETITRGAAAIRWSPFSEEEGMRQQWE